MYSPSACAIPVLTAADFPLFRSCLNERMRGSEKPAITSWVSSDEQSSTMTISRSCHMSGPGRCRPRASAGPHDCASLL